MLLFISPEKRRKIKYINKYIYETNIQKNSWTIFVFQVNCKPEGDVIYILQAI